MKKAKFNVIFCHFNWDSVNWKALLEYYFITWDEDLRNDDIFSDESSLTMYRENCERREPTK